MLSAAFGDVRDVVVHRTWGTTLVLEAAVGKGSSRVVLKASAAHDVRIEMRALQMAREAGVPAPSVVLHGNDPDLPGGRWMVMERAAGRPWASLDNQHPGMTAVLSHVAHFLTRLHGIQRPGFGWLDVRGVGAYSSWSRWLRYVLANDLRLLRSTGHLSGASATLLDSAFAAASPELDRRPAVLLHGDLGDGEIFVDECTWEVTGIVDWGEALIGDPAYELARFVAGGPVDDPRPGLMRPTVRRAYGHREYLVGADSCKCLYDAHNAIRNAAWSVRENVPWASPLIVFALARLRDVDPLD